MPPSPVMHVADILASIVLYAMYTVFVLAVVHCLAQRPSANVNATRLFLVVGMYMLATTDLVFELEGLIDASTDEPIVALSHTSSVPATAQLTLQTTLSVLGVCAVLGRVWEAWSWAYRVMLLPGVLLISVAASGLRAYAVVVNPMEDGVSLRKAEVAFLASMLAVHTLASALILYREEAQYKARTSAHFARTLVESGSLCSISWWMVFAFTWSGIDILHGLSGTIAQLTGVLPTAMIFMTLAEPAVVPAWAHDDLSTIPPTILESVEIVRPSTSDSFTEEKLGDSNPAALSKGGETCISAA